MIFDPTIFPFLWMSCPAARPGKSTCARPVTASGYRTPKMTVVTNVNQKAIRRFFFISPSNNPKVGEHYIDELDSEKRSDDPTHTVNQKVALQQSRRTQRAITHPTERERNQSDD